MNKLDFLYALSAKLSGLPESDISRSLDYYNEIIDDRIEDGMSEQQAITELGSIDDIAEQILLEAPLAKLVKAKVKPRRTLMAWEIVLLILGSPIWLSLLIAAFAVILAVYVSLWAVVISLYAANLAVAAVAVASAILMIIYFISGNISFGLFISGVSLACAGLSILMLFAFNRVTRYIAKLGKLIYIGLKRCFIRKEHTSNDKI